MDGAIIGGEGGWFVAIFNQLVGEENMASSAATCPFFSEIGRIAGNVEDHVAGTIVDRGIGVGSHVI